MSVAQFVLYKGYNCYEDNAKKLAMLQYCLGASNSKRTYLFKLGEITGYVIQENYYRCKIFR